jgi:hypothetical protein
MWLGWKEQEILTEFCCEKLIWKAKKDERTSRTEYLENI